MGTVHRRGAAGAAWDRGAVDHSAGWYPDPVARHLKLYHDGMTWTSRVQAHDGKVYTDPLENSGPVSGPTSPGYYLAPDGLDGQLRWFDGIKWTKHVRSATPKPTKAARPSRATRPSQPAQSEGSKPSEQGRAAKSSRSARSRAKRQRRRRERVHTAAIGPVSSRRVRWADVRGNAGRVSNTGQPR